MLKRRLAFLLMIRAAFVQESYAKSAIRFVTVQFFLIRVWNYIYCMITLYHTESYKSVYLYQKWNDIKCTCASVLLVVNNAFIVVEYSFASK